MRGARAKLLRNKTLANYGRARDGRLQPWEDKIKNGKTVENRGIGRIYKAAKRLWNKTPRPKR